MLSNALVACGVMDNDEMKRGALLRDGDGSEGVAFFDLALKTAMDENQDEVMRNKKVLTMAYMLIYGATKPGQLEGIKNNLFPAEEHVFKLEKEEIEKFGCSGAEKNI